MKTIKVDIIVPVYNKASYLSRCIDSILNQTYGNYNLILVDDGSVDSSGEICKRYQEMDNRVRYIYQENGGQISARRLGVENAKNEYVLFIDADDWIERDYLEVLLFGLRKGDFKADLVSSGMIIEEKNESITILDGVEAGMYSEETLADLRERFIFDEISQKQGISHSMCGKIFRKEKISEVLKDMNEKITLCEDGITIFSYLANAEYVEVLDYAGYHYVQYEDSAFHSFTEKDNWRLILLKDEYVRVATEAGIYEKIKHNIAKHIHSVYIGVITRTMGINYGMCLVLPDFLRRDGIEVVIYGAGVKGRQFKAQISKVKKIKCVGWVDKKYKSIPKEYGVEAIERLLEWKYDYILIAIEDRDIVHSVVENLLCMGIPYKKIWALETRLDFCLKNMDY